MKLTEEEARGIRQYVNESGITIQTLKDDLVDHLMCVIETESRSGKGYRESISQADVRKIRY